MLSASLALVKPAGMTAKEAEDWLEAAFEALCHIPLDIFRTGVRAARLTCDHPSKIVPAVAEATREALEWRNRPRTAPVLRLVAPAAPPVERQPLPDPECLNAGLRRMGISAGWLVEDAEGRVIWTEEGAA